jgi:hypothetical protein
MPPETKQMQEDDKKTDKDANKEKDYTVISILSW